MKTVTGLVVAVALFGPTLWGGFSVADTIALDPDKWVFRFGKGTGDHPKAELGGIGFDVPRWDGQIDYLTRPYGQNIKDKTLTLTGTIVTSSDVVFKAPATNCPGAPASFRFIVQRKDDALLNKSNYRFWSKASIRPVAGTRDFTLTTKVSSDVWTNVDGQINANGFANLMSNMANIGVTMVGPNDCSYGHGLGVSRGSAHMVFKTFTVN